MLSERGFSLDMVDRPGKPRNNKSVDRGDEICTVGQYIAGDTEQAEARDGAKSLLTDLGLPGSAREVTETGNTFDAKILDKLIQNLSPERQGIINMLKSYIGTNEKTNATEIDKFHNSAGQNGSSVETAWCMSFVQHILKQSGNKNYKATPRARDGLKIGIATSNPQPGDLLIVERGGGGHIGFFVGLSESGNPIIIGGNQGDGEVSIKEETRKILGYRSIV